MAESKYKQLETRLSALESWKESLQEANRKLSEELEEVKKEVRDLRAKVDQALSPGNRPETDPSDDDHLSQNHKPRRRSTRHGRGDSASLTGSASTVGLEEGAAPAPRTDDAGRHRADNATQTDTKMLQNSVKVAPDQKKPISKMNKAELRREVETHRVTVLENDQSLQKLQNDMTALQELHDEMAEDNQKSLGTIRTEIKTRYENLQSELQSEISTLREEEGSLKESLSQTETELRTLKTKIDKTSKLVAFHAMLKSSIRTKEVTTLICSNVVTNISGSYNGKTGIFACTAPGTYCFLATSSPNERDDNKMAAVDIVVDNRVMGGLCSYGFRWSTGHCVVKLKAGQQVWLRTVDGEHTFAGEWWTTFSGMLLQPEV